MRRRSWAHSIRETAAFTTPSPRLVRGRLRPAFSLSPPRSGDVPSSLATNGDGDASSGFFAIRFFFLARGNVGVAPALAGPRGTTAARNGERGPNTPDRRCNGNRGGGIKLERRDRNCTGVITRCVAPLRLGLRRRYATRPSARIDRRSKLNGGEDARSILDNTRRALNDSAEPAAAAGVNVIKVALQQTRSAGADGEKLATQLDTLRAALADPSVSPEALGRGGPEAAIELQSAADALWAVAKERAGAQGTPAETELLDLLDGIIIGLTRGARKAARAAAKRLGTPALTADFDRTKLYASRGAGKGSPAPEPIPAPTDG